MAVPEYAAIPTLTWAASMPGSGAASSTPDHVGRAGPYRVGVPNAVHACLRQAEVPDLSLGDELLHQPVLDRLEGRDRMAEHVTLLDVIQGERHRGLLTDRRLKAGLNLLPV